MTKPSLLKRLYRRLPVSIRGLPIIYWAKTFAQSHVLPHDWVYDSEYYSTEARKASLASAPVIAATIHRELAPRKVIDVGCGTGDVIMALRELGCEVAGLERSAAAIDVCQSRDLPVRAFDLEQDHASDGAVYDVVVSMEVAEHLPERIADRYVDLLTSLGHIIVFTAAPPGQGGTDHINEQPPEYWHEKFAKRGFRLDAHSTQQWQREWRERGQVARWYHLNLMIFRLDQASTS